MLARSPPGGSGSNRRTRARRRPASSRCLRDHMPTELARLRNFCIIAHIDHGKSTLADRLLDLTHAVSERNMRAQYLDKMDLERERGITIKAQAVRLAYAAADGHEYVLNLIDTPGHVDFSYEVSRALAACEGAVLLVDAAQGIEAQTLANLYLAVEADLTILPVINKIDLPAAQPDRVAREIEQVLGVPAHEMLRVSAKTGEGVPALLEALVGRVPPPMVYSGLYPIEGDDFPDLRDALDRLRLNDAALMYEPETSTALGFGFRCGFLGLLHMDIVRERLEREFDLALITTAPNVAYRVTLVTGETIMVSNPSELPAQNLIDRIEEPFVAAMVLCPADYIGAVMELCQGRRGALDTMEYLSEERVELRYQLPLAEIIFGFFDQLKSRTRGYASLDYEPSGYREADLVKVDVLLQGEPVDAFSAIVHKDKAQNYGRAMTTKLRRLIPRQLYEVAIQAAIGSRVIARETISARRKDVLAKCYGGDVTRKRKLLERQKEGKRRMKQIGRVEVPQEAFVAALRTDEGGTR